MTEKRTNCFNPPCRRTFKYQEGDETREVVCGKCWKLLPQALRQEYKHLKARRLKITRRLRKKGVENVELPHLRARQEANWRAIHDFYAAPQKPAGLDTFLEEIGFDR